jgi:hypothetical protein
VVLGAVSPFLSLIRGADGGAAHCLYEHEGPTLSIPVRFLRATAFVVVSCVGRVFAMDEFDDTDLVVERVAALDLGKAGLEACVRVPHPQRPGGGCRSCAATPRPPHNCWRWRPGCGTGTCSGW